ncbi:TonB-dependent receptor [Stakelama sediminis]|uniref:Outer membrane receptor for ferrienterochelin and colicin n=1 Tax=Stakelama sediminis TaxID=463200 RepID=A0A840YZG6_9SPHN|nr:TonB-dependent receptor [Stakelama sediminis]MBB5719043.1 outer membrane receptor for ferrienterochelin and colicin [Stakelama sediminis]
MRNQFLMGAAVAALIVPAAASAQQLTTGIQGTVTSEAGAPVAGATVVVTDTRTGSSRSITTGPQGRFNADNLTPGGPYAVYASADGFEGQTVNNITTTLQGNTSLTFKLASGQGDIVVTSSRANVTQLAVGPGVSFGQQTIENAPSYGRDIQDVIRYDPRVTLSNSDGQTTYSCLGGNNRSNGFTVDGIQQGDVFGLNGTAYASRTSAPLPYDAMQEIQVQFAPYDVEYDGFTGCQVNVVTKSGTNKFHGNGYFEYSDNGLRGTKVQGNPVGNIDPEKRWGVSLGGPIIKDHLFFYGAYSHISTAKAQDYGPEGAGYPNTLSGVTEAQFNQISQIAKTVYGEDTGPLVNNLPYTNDRYFGRLDWQINDKHRLTATYQHLDEVALSADDFGTNAGNVQLVGKNTYENSGTKSDYYSARLFSNWTDNFSTEIRYSHAQVDDIQDPFGGGEAQSSNPIPRLIVGIDNGTGDNATVLIGPGQYRSANQLNTTIDQGTALAKLTMGSHKIKFGMQYNKAKIYNLFVSNATGTLVFDNVSDFQNGILSNGTSTNTSPDTVVSGNSLGAFGNFSATGDVNDAAARFTRTIFSGFAQDDWQMTDALNMVAGVRVQWYSGDHPLSNPTFTERYGRTNTVGFSKLPIQVLPRVAFTYDAGDFGPLTQNKLRLGVGMFTGGDPLVWFSNAYSNNGFASARGTLTAAGCPSGPVNVLSGGSFTGIPSCVVADGAAAAAQGAFTVQSIDPNIKMPTVLRANVGFESDLNFASSGLLSNWHVKADYIFSHYRNPFAVADLTQVVDPSQGLNGYTIDGRPIYRSMDPLAAGCNAVLESSSPTPTYSGVTAACFNTSRYGAIDLTNSAGYNSQVASFILSKHVNHGIFTDGGSFDFMVGYAYTDAQDRRALTSSQATSNFKYPSTFDIQNPAAARGLFSQTNNISMNMNFSETFFGDLKTKLGITFNATSGTPFSLTYKSSNLFAITNYGYNALIYVPTGSGDPNISPLSYVDNGGNLTAADVDGYANFAKTHACTKNYVGRSIARDSCTNPWYFDMDLVFSQELPGPGHLFGVNDKIKVYAMVDNFLNLLDNHWNVLERNTSYGSIALGDISGIDPQGRYIMSNASTSSYDYRNVDTTASLWRLKVGVSYDF